MLLKARIEDLMFTYDFKSFLEPHIYSEFRGHGSSGQIHVFDSNAELVVRTQYWHQSPTWLPEDGSSLQVLTKRPDLRGMGDVQVQVSPFTKSAMQGLAALQKSVLKWMIERKSLGLATENDIESWRMHFARISPAFLLDLRPHAPARFNFLSLRVIRSRLAVLRLCPWSLFRP